MSRLLQSDSLCSSGPCAMIQKFYIDFSFSFAISFLKNQCKKCLKKSKKTIEKARYMVEYNRDKI